MPGPVPFDDLQDLLGGLRAPSENVHDVRTTFTAVAGKFFSSWRQAGSTLGAGSIPSSAAVPSRTSAGAIGQGDPSGTVSWLSRVDFTRNAYGMLWLCDRLSHQGGLSGTVATAQTTNLPTSALTRYTDGVGVWAALEIYTAVGTTARTATVSYTDQGGTSGNTSTPVPFGGTGDREANRLIPIGLTQPDSGVRAVASVTLSGSTGTAGDFGVTLFKPLLCIPMPIVPSYHFTFDSLTNLGGQFPGILADACLFWVYRCQGTSLGTQTSRLVMLDK